MATDTKAKSKPEAFVEMVIGRISGDNPDAAFRAAFSRADNPAFEYQCWEYLIKWQLCDIERSRELKAFVLIGAALAKKTKARIDGHLGIGQAIAQCYADEGKNNGHEKDGAKTKLRRLLACDTTEEACDILRPLLGFIKSQEVPLNYAGLLKELLYSDEWFNDRIKPRWAKNFYYKKEEA